MYCNKENVNILTALLVAHEVKHVVVCPGSRNSPLVHNFNECPDIICHPVTDERSASFIALGLRLQLHAPVVVCVTSGSALLNTLPGVAEASYQNQGIIVISADRPAAWINQLDGQTLPQPSALGSFVAKSVNLPEPHNDEERWYCNRLINEAFMAYYTSGEKSIHINVPISEPLFEYNVNALPEERVVRLSKTLNVDIHDKILLVVGQLNHYTQEEFPIHQLAARVVVLNEPLSSNYSHLSFADQMLAALPKSYEEYLPDVVIYMGGHTISKRLRHFLRSLPQHVKQYVVNPEGEFKDVSCQTTCVLQMSPQEVVKELLQKDYSLHRDFLLRWAQLREKIASKHAAFMPAYSQMLAIKMFENEGVKEGDIVCYANSSAVRLAALYAWHYCFCNRGINGIEGSLSTAVGAMLSAVQKPSRNVYCVIGDLSFFYDENALWQQQINGSLRILLLNNHQGGIFCQLPGLEACPVRDEMIAGKHYTSAEGVCKQFNVNYYRANNEIELQQGLQTLTTAESARPILLEVFTNSEVDAQEIKKYYSFLISNKR